MPEAGDKEAEVSGRPESSKISIWLYGGALAVAVGMIFPGLGRHAFWHDEAHTALFGRNILKMGERAAWDGRNLIGYAGGVELSPDLAFVRAPPQEQYLAAVGMAMLGDSRSGARAPFAVLGLLGVAAIGWWARAFLGSRFPWWLPPVLLALSPAYLLYVRNCRYYAPGVFWAILLWAAWCAACLSRNRPRLYAGVAMVAILGLCSSQYVYAMAAAGILPLFLLDARFRKKEAIFLLGILGLIAVAYMLCVYLFANPLGEGESGEGGLYSAIFRKIAVLGWWQVRDMGFFEFFAWPMLLPLLLPWIVPRFALLRPLARCGWFFAGLLAGIIVITAAVSPQELLFIEDADIRAEMRYVFPAIPVGVMISAVSLCLLWKIHKTAAIILAVVAVGTNVLHLGATDPQPRHAGGASRVRSTLVDFVKETAVPVDSVYDTLVASADSIPAGTTMRFFPFYAAYPLMFERPDLHYSNQLEPGVAVRPELRAQLPAYVLSNYRSEICVVYGPLRPSPEPGQPDQLSMVDLPQDLPQFLSQFNYRQTRTQATAFPVGARPEIPRHRFAAPKPGDGSRGVFIFYARTPKGAPGEGGETSEK